MAIQKHVVLYGTYIKGVARRFPEIRYNQSNRRYLDRYGLPHLDPAHQNVSPARAKHRIPELVVARKLALTGDAGFATVPRVSLRLVPRLRFALG